MSKAANDFLRRNHKLPVGAILIVPEKVHYYSHYNKQLFIITSSNNNNC